MKSLSLVLIFCSVFSNWNLCQSQTITISGATTVTPGANEYYEVSFDYTVNPYAILTWSVTGGTITSQAVNPTSTVYCYVDWDNTNGTGSISLYEDLNGISGNLNVQRGTLADPCFAADAGPDKGFCTTGPVTIGTSGYSGYTYSWSPGTGLSSTTIAQPSANPGSTTTYTLIVTPPNLLTNGDFESGFSGFATDYGPFPAGGSCNPWGRIGVATSPASLNSNWCNYSDHTPSGSNMLVLDGSCNATDRVWSQTVGVNPNTLYTFSGWTSSNYNYSPATLKVRINNQDIITNFTVNYSSCTGWSQFSANWTSGSSDATATIEIFDTNVGGIGNDFNLDDLAFSCPVTTDQVTVYVGTPSISQSGPITRCVQYETGVWLTLTTNITSNIQWYENGNPISGATSSTLNLNGNPNGGAGWPTCTSTITVKNTATNCTSSGIQVTRKNFTSPQVHLYEGPPYSTPTSYCKSIGGSIQQVPSLNAGTTYGWELYDPNGNPATGYSISPNYTTNRTATITFSTYSYSTALVVAKATDNGCNGAWDGSWQQSYIISVNQGCKTENLVTKSEGPSVENAEDKQTRIYPNPANNEIVVSASKNMSQISIYDAAGALVKQNWPTGANIVAIDVSSLKPGFYSCRIHYPNGQETLKFIVQRK